MFFYSAKSTNSNQCALQPGCLHNYSLFKGTIEKVSFNFFLISLVDLNVFTWLGKSFQSLGPQTEKA